MLTYTGFKHDEDVTMKTPTHSIFTHYRTLLHAHRRILWAHIRPLSACITPNMSIIRHFSKGGY